MSARMATEKRPGRHGTALNPCTEDRRCDRSSSTTEILVLPRSIGFPKRFLAEVAETLIMDPRQLDFWLLLLCAANQSEWGVYS